MSVTVLPVRFGEIVRAPVEKGLLDRVFIMHNCGKDEFPAFYCDSCDASFANLGNLMMHLESAEGEHRLIVWCRHHKWWETVSAGQVEGFVKAGLVAA